MALDLKKMERELDEALAKETPQSLSAWLHNERELERLYEHVRNQQYLQPVKVWTKEEVEANRSNAYKYII